MPRLSPATQIKRRENILDAAERCFARSGFHRTTMQDIGREAGVSLGALYVYFDNKEALIAGLCERDRAEFQDKLEKLSAAPDLLAALRGIGDHYFHEQPAHKRLVAVEMGVESTRNPRIAEICRPIDKHVQCGFAALFERLEKEGRIAPVIDVDALAKVFHVIGDGLFWRRAVDPEFDAIRTLPAVLKTLEIMLNPAPLPTDHEATVGALAAAPAETVEPRARAETVEGTS